MDFLQEDLLKDLQISHNTILTHNHGSSFIRHLYHFVLSVIGTG